MKAISLLFLPSKIPNLYKYIDVSILGFDGAPSVKFVPFDSSEMLKFFFLLFFLLIDRFRYGEIVDVNLVRDKGTGKSKGFAFLAYEDQRSTILAVG